MSTFGEDWERCMTGKGLPVPSVEDANEALEFLHQLHSAMDNVTGGEAEMTIGTLLASGALGGIGEGSLVILGGIAQTLVAVYLSQAISCLGVVAGGELRKLFSSNELADFVVAELDIQGIDLAGGAAA